MNNRGKSSQDRIGSFLADQCLLVTGVTGFLGKPLLEKLLRAVPDVGRVYLLIRPRSGTSGASVQERFEREVLASGVFDHLRAEHGRTFSEFVAEKIRVVPGDISLPRLGLSDALYAELTARVQVVINSAAVVVFDERLDVAVELNTLAPHRLVEFARACSDAMLIHVSTAYVNGQNPEVAPESLLPTETNLPDGWKGPSLPADLMAEVGELQRLCAQVEAQSKQPGLQGRFTAEAKRIARAELKATHADGLQKEIEAARLRWVKEQLIQVGMSRAKARRWNDTYTFTKAMGEQMIAQTRGDLPVAIVRPSIIESSLHEPEPGWIDGYRMADPIIVAFGKGRVPDFPANPKIVMDLIPVDYVVNAILATIPELAAHRGFRFYQVATSARNPLSFQELYDLTREHFVQEPMLDRGGFPIPLRSWSFPTIEAFRRRLRWRMLLPLRAALWAVDRLPSGKRGRRWRSRLNSLLNAAERLDYYTVIYGPYIRYSYRFDTTQTHGLFEGLSADEQARYPFDVSQINWSEYVIRTHIPGLKRNVLKLSPGRVRPPIAEEEILNERTPTPSEEGE